MKFETNNLDLMSRILYKNEACIVINKLKGEVAEGALEEACIPKGTSSSKKVCAKDGIVNLPLILKEHLSVEFAEAVHRLDVPVTGCLLFALNSGSLKFLNAAFARETSPDKAREWEGSSHSLLNNAEKPNENTAHIEKIYWTIIEKPFSKLEERRELVHWIEENTRVNKSFAYNEQRAGRKKAALKYRITGEGVNYLFIEVKLLSGRHHQIRSQFAALGLHIKGDLKYGAKRSEKGGGIRLHARSLSFPNPMNKDEKITVTADPPQMDNLWKDFILTAISPER